MESEIELALNRMRNNRKEREVHFNNEVDVNEKENSHPLRDKTKSRLERLGVLYGGGEVSSPIHKSEQEWENEEGDEAQSDDKSPYAELRTKRLQALAHTINSWEDDMRHISPPKKEQGERIDRFGNKVGDKAVKHETVRTSPLKTQNKQTPKKVAWDNKIINSLEMQGFKRCDSEEHLVYNYTSPNSKECLTPSKNKLQGNNVINYNKGTTPNRKVIKSDSVQVPVCQKSPLPKVVPVFQKSPLPKVVPVPTMETGIKPSMVKSIANQFRQKSPQRTAVLELAAQYEGDSPSPSRNNTAKDPALLSVAEKKAVFERNKGAAPLPQPIVTRPRALSPPKRLPARTFQLEPKPENSPIKDNVKQAMIERFQELEALRHRWDRNKMLAEGNVPQEVEDEEEIEEWTSPNQSAEVVPPPPPMPSHSTVIQPLMPSPPAVLSPPQQIKMGISSPVRRNSPARKLPRVLCVKEKTQHNNTGVHYPEVKKIKVSPPKPGHLYPSISDIEVDSETAETDLETIDEESMEEDEQVTTSSMYSSSLETTHSSESSFGQTIVRQASRNNLKRPSHSLEESTGSESESKILQEMDDLLDEALGSPSPKRAKESMSFMDMMNASTGSCSTNSFEFSEIEQMKNEREESLARTPLMHTVSVHRRQPNLSVLTPVRKEVKKEVLLVEEEMNEGYEEELVQEKIKELTIEVQKQIETVSQASKALNLCLSTPGFTGSIAEVEAQKLLLVASSRWTTFKQEIERLKIERRLCSSGPGLDRGTIMIQSLSVPLKASYAPSRDQSRAHLTCLVRSGCVVLQTEVITLDKPALRDGRINFQKILNLVDLYSDFTVSIEVYGFMVQRPTNLGPDYKGRTTPTKKDKGRTFGTKKAKDKFPPIESPAGPNAVRSSAFQLWGFAVFSLRELNRTSFSLSKVPYTCPLEGSIEINMSSSMQSQVEHSDYLTVFEDVGGFGNWRRRWAELRGSLLTFYPDDCRREGRVSVDIIDLTNVSTVEAALAPRDICSRRHTIFLESQLRGSTLPESLVVKKRGDITVVMHLLSADSKDDCTAWCKQINKVLHLLRAWKVNNATAV